MTSESHIASIDYRATIVVRSFICECDVALERYRSYTYKCYLDPSVIYSLCMFWGGLIHLDPFHVHLDPFHVYLDPFHVYKLF